MIVRDLAPIPNVGYIGADGGFAGITAITSTGACPSDRRKSLQEAEEVGFEPTVGLHQHRFSRPALSTTQAPLRACGTSTCVHKRPLWRFRYGGYAPQTGASRCRGDRASGTRTDIGFRRRGASGDTSGGATVCHTPRRWRGCGRPSPGTAIMEERFETVRETDASPIRLRASEQRPHADRLSREPGVRSFGRRSKGHPTRPPLPCPRRRKSRPSAR